MLLALYPNVSFVVEIYYEKLPFDLSRQNNVLCSLIILISNACPALKIGREFSQKSFQNFFLLLDFSGSLSTLRKLDRETSAQFSLQITAEDGGGKVSNDRWITRRLFKDEMLKVRGVSPPFELHF